MVLSHLSCWYLVVPTQWSLVDSGNLTWDFLSYDLLMKPWFLNLDVGIPPLIHIQISWVAGSVVSDRTPPSAPSSRACSPPSWWSRAERALCWQWRSRVWCRTRDAGAGCCRRPFLMPLSWGTWDFSPHYTVSPIPLHKFPHNQVDAAAAGVPWCYICQFLLVN